jgi:hypothetical protein
MSVAELLETLKTRFVRTDHCAEELIAQHEELAQAIEKLAEGFLAQVPFCGSVVQFIASLDHSAKLGHLAIDDSHFREQRRTNPNPPPQEPQPAELAQETVPGAGAAPVEPPSSPPEAPVPVAPV